MNAVHDIMSVSEKSMLAYINFFNHTMTKEPMQVRNSIVIILSIIAAKRQQSANWLAAFGKIQIYLCFLYCAAESGMGDYYDKRL